VGLFLRVVRDTLILPGSVLVWIPWFLVVGTSRYTSHWPPTPGDIPAVIVMAIGVTIYTMCAVRFATEGKGTPAPWDAPRRIVIGGIYTWTRNPMYVGVITAMLGEAWLINELAMWVYALAMPVAFHLRVTRYEEPAMRRLSETDFLAYTSRVKRWGLF
jgi:protein-S-isoprenylcysteine O-methyltransferase Ste14